MVTVSILVWMKCFECGDVGHKCLTCPHKQYGAVHAVDDAGCTTFHGAVAGTASVACASVTAAFVSAAAHGSQQHG